MTTQTNYLNQELIMDEEAFLFFADQLKKMSLYQITQEKVRILKAVKGWDQYPFGVCHVRDGNRMLDMILKERRQRYLKTYRQRQKELVNVCDQEGGYPDW